MGGASAVFEGPVSSACEPEPARWPPGRSRGRDHSWSGGGGMLFKLSRVSMSYLVNAADTNASPQHRQTPRPSATWTARSLAHELAELSRRREGPCLQKVLRVPSALSVHSCQSPPARKRWEQTEPPSILHKSPMRRQQVRA